MNVTDDLAERKLQVIVLGASTSFPCGIRDYAELLTASMERTGVEASTCWIDRYKVPHGTGQVKRTLRQHRHRTPPSALLWHYSPFGYGWRGLPFLTPTLLARLAHARLPIVVVAHEIAVPWRCGALRGVVTALFQRLVFMMVAHSASLIVVTTVERANWLESRWWLPHRCVSVIPVIPTIPVVGTRSIRSTKGRVGVIGYAREAGSARMIASACGRATYGDGRPITLVLLGAPGSECDIGRQWTAAAKEASCTIEWTGVIEKADLSRCLATVDLVVFPDRMGPTARRTTLAATLAHGLPVIAFDGRETWEALRDNRGVRLVAAETALLSQAIEDLLEDAEEREQLAGRGLSFYRTNMDPDIVARAIVDLLALAANGRGSRCEGAIS